jgi:hypothetical protein
MRVPLPQSLAQSLAILTLLAAPLAATSCKSVDCGEGTTERNGTCVPANETVSNATCGKFTELKGTECAPEFDPTVCDPATTQADTDPATGVTTCIGTGASSCASKLPCPTPADSTQAICGQIYDFETNTPFAAPGATGARCTASATSGPCSLGIKAYDAAALVANPPTPTNPGAAPLAATVSIDDCGRYQVTGIAQPGGPLVALALDDAQAGPPGTTNAVGVTTPKAPNTAVKDFDHFVVPATASSKWDGGASGPSLANGIFAAVYRAHATGTDAATGVTLTIAPKDTPANQAPDPARTFYFAGATRATLDTALTATAANGGALLTGANLGEVYSGGGGGIPAGCMWEIHPGAAIPGTVFIQVFRPTAQAGQTCTP